MGCHQAHSDILLHVQPLTAKFVYCPADEMTAELNTKPLQGSKFVEFCDKLLGISTEDFDEYKSQYVEVLKSYDIYDEELEKNLFQ